jgi:hypothetical protein
MTMLMLGLFLLGPFATLGIWLWLRSRREPAQLIEAFDIGRVMGRSFAAFGREGWPLAGLALLLVGLPQALWMTMLRAMMPQLSAAPPGARANAQADRLIGLFHAFPATMIGGMLALLLCSFLFYIAAIRFWAQRGEGRGGTPGSAIRLAPRLLLPVLAVAMLGYLGFLASLLLFVVPGVVMALNWLAAIPVMVNERTGIIEALRRSRALAIGSRGRILVAALLMLVLTMLVSLIGNVAMRGLIGDSGPASVLLIGVQALVAILSAIVHAGFFAAVYVELRRVREGLAVPMLAEVFA